MLDSKGNIWIAETGSGFCVCTPGEDYAKLEFTHYGVSDGLVNDMVQAFAEDKGGQIWITTEYGVSCFDPASETFLNYFFSTHMLRNVYNETAMLVLPNGKVIMGANQGATIVNPEQIKSGQHVPAVTFTTLKLNSTSADATYSGTLSELSLPYSESVKLNHEQHSFSIYFSTLDYSAVLPWAVKLEAGVKTSLTETQNMSHYDLSSLPVQDDDFTYTENIYAGYLVLNKTLGSFDFVLGGRYELTHTKSQSKGGTATTDNYGRFFPNVHVMYRTKNGSSFDLGVNSGIKRPGIQVVNPFRAYVSANSIAQGNPTIRPDHWFNVRLTSNIVLCSGLDLGSEITFTREFDNITQITEMDGTNGISTTSD